MLVELSQNAFPVRIEIADPMAEIGNQDLAIESRVESNVSSQKEFKDLKFLLQELNSLNAEEDRRIKYDLGISDIENTPCSKVNKFLRKSLYFLRSLTD